MQVNVSRSATQTAIDDRTRRIWEILHWTSGAIFWTFIVFAFCFMVFKWIFPESTRPRVSGDATVNRLGDVVQWNASAVIDRDMMHQDFFALLPENRRTETRLAFTRAWDGDPYKFPRVVLDGGRVDVTFERQGNVCLAMLTR